MQSSFWRDLYYFTCLNFISFRKEGRKKKSLSFLGGQLKIIKMPVDTNLYKLSFIWSRIYLLFFLNDQNSTKFYFMYKHDHLYGVAFKWSLDFNHWKMSICCFHSLKIKVTFQSPRLDAQLDFCSFWQVYLISLFSMCTLCSMLLYSWFIFLCYYTILKMKLV